MAMHMYNRERKVSFIKQYTNSINTATHVEKVFNAFEPYEREKNADLCTMSAEDLQPVFDKISGYKYKTHFWNVAVIKEYVKWCIQMEIPGATNNIDSVKIPGLQKVRTEMVSSPLHLQRYLDIMFDPEDHETMDVIYRTFYWLSYSGVDDEDIFEITASDLDFKKMSIKYKGSTLPIYREALPALLKAATLNSLVFKHPNYNSIIRRDRVPGKKIMRGVKAEGNLLTIRGILSKKSMAAVSRGETDLRLSFHRVKLSGLFYRMYERERAGYDVDFTSEAINYLKDKSYSGGRTENARRNMVIRDYMENYERWKLAFSI